MIHREARAEHPVAWQVLSLTPRPNTLPGRVLWLLLAVMAFSLGNAYAKEAAPISQATQDCIQCHSAVSPSIVEDWKRSRHSRVTPGEAVKKPELERRVSAQKVPEKLTSTAVGCAECHTLNTDAHKDTFSHNEVQVHVLVTPKDCSTCHPTEAAQFDKNLMSHARGNLVENKLYQTLTKSVTGHQSLKELHTEIGPPDEKTLEESCAHCHGTAVEVMGKTTRETDQGEMEFPVLSGWPNQGVGRFNPDGSKGSCAACHSRHQFAIQMARQPYTCSQCHKGPDVPAYPVYGVSKHGNLFSAMN
ncbi:MAG: multiheme c-type cytochrome [Thermodesulfobacteriota bacterium]